MSDHWRTPGDRPPPARIPGGSEQDYADLLPRNSRTGEIEDTPLVDDLADVLAKTVVGWQSVIGVDLAEQPEVVRVMARYREEKGR